MAPPLRALAQSQTPCPSARRVLPCSAASGCAPGVQPQPQSPQLPPPLQRAPRRRRRGSCGATSGGAPTRDTPALPRRAALAALLLPLAARPAHAGTEWVAPWPGAGGSIEDVEILMGGERGGLNFVPDRVVLKRGHTYRLILSNPSKVYHNFVATDFLLHGAYWLLTRIGDAGETEWYVMPHKEGLYEFKCTVVGHEGMKGVLEVVA